MADDMTQSVPASSGQGDASTAVDKLQSIMSEQAASLNKAAQAASVPSATPAHSYSIPTALSGQQREAAQAPMITRQVVGKKAAKQVGIGNAFIGAMNAVSGVTTAVENLKSTKIADATQKLMELQHNIDQDSLIKPEDGAEVYAAAQKRIMANTSNQQHLLSDNTIRKGIQKGMQIDFTDPSANQTTEHKGVQQGRAAAERSVTTQSQGIPGGPPGKTTTVTQGQDPNALAHSFQAGLPQAPQQDPRAMTKYQTLVAQQKDTFAVLKATMPAEIKADSAEHIAQIKKATELLKAKNAADERWEMLQKRQNFEIQRMNAQHKFEINKLHMETNEVIKREDARINLANSDPTTIIKNAQVSQDEDAHLIAATQNHIANLKAQEMATTDEGQKAELRKMIAAASEIETAQTTNQTNHLAIWNAKKIQRGIVTDVKTPGEADGKSTGNARSGTGTASANTANRFQAGAYLDLGAGSYRQ